MLLRSPFVFVFCFVFINAMMATWLRRLVSLYKNFPLSLPTANRSVGCSGGEDKDMKKSNMCELDMLDGEGRTHNNREERTEGEKESTS